MLYVSTRDNREVYTSHHALTRDTAPDGGLFVPFRIPEHDAQPQPANHSRTFSQSAADLMNLLFKQHLTAWDVEFAVGRYPVRISSPGHRIRVAECWHNPHWNLGWLEEKLCGLLRPEFACVTDWFAIGTRLSVLAGICDGTLRDIAIPGDDPAWAAAALYAPFFGIPVGTVVVCCEGEDTLWNFLHKGVLAVPIPGLERLLNLFGGPFEVSRYLSAMHTDGIYMATDGVLEAMKRRIHVCVVGSQRIPSVVANVQRALGYRMSRQTALCYCGLQDYRAVAPESRDALVISGDAPVTDECDKEV